MFFRDVIYRARILLSGQPKSIQREFNGLALLTLLMGFVELGVAGFVSLFGVALASPLSLFKLEPLQWVIEKVPELEKWLADPIMLLLILLAFVAFSVLVKNVLMGVLVYRQNLFSQVLTALNGSALFKAHLAQEYQWHVEKNAGELTAIAGFRVYVSAFFMAFLTIFAQLTISICLIVGGLCLAPIPTILVLGMTGFAALLTYKVTRKRIHEHSEAIATAQIVLGKDLLAGFQGIRDIKVYQRENALAQRVDLYLHSMATHSAACGFLPMTPSWVLETVGMLGLLLSFCVMLSTGSSLATITGSLALIAAMAWRLLPCMNKVVTAIITIQGYKPYLERFCEALEQASIPEALDRPEEFSFDEMVLLDNISYKYPRAERMALCGISVSISKGIMVGIIGPSGAGKSTLIGILTGLLQPSAGSVRIDGVALDASGYGKLRSLIGYVPQSPYLIDGSLAENVAFSRLGEPIDEKRIHEACEMAALDFWDDLPDGIYSEIGERGIRLSGGQAQRIAIARAIYAHPELLVFDEATSALDGATESAIQDTINSLRDNITIVMIAHRLSTVASCDVIYWIEDGEIILSGSPKEVIPKYEAALRSPEHNRRNQLSQSSE